ncbi:hypothetical protein [Nakamurella sp. PAMC28650]|uniref:hypothetical protein n=1 Tax=Nakamurella sp. PAMC28650 TaxID=2762325 RepID=UPI00164E2E51|nr:hypothetical protein [Nakamurella sp. PAMC28650]QNK81543.1 hypothetical protein H7F38_01465 [Nakamurella sp. PAMC28650]
MKRTDLTLRGRARVLAVALIPALTLVGYLPVKAAPAYASAPPNAGVLSVFVGYAEDKEINTPDPASFPIPWAGAPNTVFLGGPVPGQTACGSLTTCYDAGAIRLDNHGGAPVTVTNVSVDIHASITGGKLFKNLWGTVIVPAGQSAILTENPSTNNPKYDNFDTSGYPANHCTPVDVAPTVTLTINGASTTLVDSTHVLDTGGIDAGYCKQNESIQWRPIGSAGTKNATLTLGATSATAFAGHPVTHTATLLDGAGVGIPNAAVRFTVTYGPDAGLTGTATTDGNGLAYYTYTGASQGEDLLIAAATTVGSFQSVPARVMWTNGTATGWTAADVGSATPAATQTFDITTGQWTVHGGGAGIGMTADQLHFLWKGVPDPAGIGAHLTAISGGSGQAGLMLRSGTDPGSPYYAATAAAGRGITIEDRTTPGGPTATVTTTPIIPAYLWVATTNGLLTTYASDDGYLWYPVTGSTVPLDLGSSVLAGMAVTSRDTTQLSTATFDDVAVSSMAPAPPPPVPCPAPWMCADIGNPTPTGSQSFDPGSGTWTVSAAGADITGIADQFRFLRQPLSGDGSITTRITSQTNTSSSAKVGLMFRSDADPGSPDYAVLVTPGTGIKVQSRSSQGATTTKLANTTGTTPVFLKATRAGATFTAYTSPDGLIWALIPGSTTTMNLPSTVLEGLAVSSHHPGTLGIVTATIGATP